MFIIEIESGIEGFCLLGEGSTEAEAWADAFGPKPWTPYVRRNVSQAWCSEVSETELQGIKENRANR